MKEIYTSNHMWQLFEKSFLLDMAVVANATHDRRHADVALERYVTSTVMDIVTTFFKSPFSEQSTAIQVLNFLFHPGFPSRAITQVTLTGCKFILKNILRFGDLPG